MRVDRKTPIIFNFVGLFDTVASFGLIHKNDVSQLNLKMGAKPNKVVHLIASDEYRENFKLTNIDSTIKQDEFLYRIQEQILKYAKENDGINSIKVHLSKDDLHKLRHQYLHRSNQDDDIVAMYGRYKERHFTRINYEKVCNNRHYSASDRNTRLL